MIGSHGMRFIPGTNKTQCDELSVSSSVLNVQDLDDVNLAWVVDYETHSRQSTSQSTSHVSEPAQVSASSLGQQSGLAQVRVRVPDHENEFRRRQNPKSMN